MHKLGSSKNSTMRIIPNSPSIILIMKYNLVCQFLKKNSQYCDKPYKHLQVSAVTYPATGKQENRWDSCHCIARRNSQNSTSPCIFSITFWTLTLCIFYFSFDSIFYQFWKHFCLGWNKFFKKCIYNHRSRSFTGYKWRRDPKEEELTSITKTHLL